MRPTQGDLEGLAGRRQRIDPLAREPHDRRVERAAETALGGADDQQMDLILAGAGQKLRPRVDVGDRRGDVAEHLLHALGIGPRGFGRSLGAAQLRRRDHLHGLGDLLRRLGRGEADTHALRLPSQSHQEVVAPPRGLPPPCGGVGEGVTRVCLPPSYSPAHACNHSAIIVNFLRECLGVGFHHALELGLGGAGKIAGLANVFQDVVVLGANERQQAVLERAHAVDRHPVEIAVDAGIDDDDLLLHLQRRELRLLQELGEPRAAVEHALGGGVEIGAELREGGHLAVLRELALDLAGDLLHRLGLRGGADARHREADVHRRADALIEQVGLQEDLTVGDRNHVGRDVGRHVVGLGLDDRQRGQRARPAASPILAARSSRRECR